MTLRLLRLLAARGRDSAAICRKAGVSADEVGNPLARVPYQVADRLLEACVEELGTRGFALQLSRTTDPDTYDAAGLLLMSSATFGEGLEHALGYQRLWADGQRFAFERTPRGGSLRFRHPGTSPVACAVLAELAFLEVMLAARALVTPQARPLSVCFTHTAPTADPLELAQGLGVEAVFGARQNELVLAKDLLAEPVRPPEGALRRSFELLANRALAALPASASTAARLEAVLGEGSFKMSLTAAAAYLRVPERSLQRQLRSEGTSWTELVDVARRKRVQELSVRGVAEKELSYLVGFADPSALARARRRWSLPRL
jgi:AraC-like DNA-binding protein